MRPKGILGSVPPPSLPPSAAGDGEVAAGPARVWAHPSWTTAPTRADIIEASAADVSGPLRGRPLSLLRSHPYARPAGMFTSSPIPCQLGPLTHAAIPTTPAALPEWVTAGSEYACAVLLVRPRLPPCRRSPDGPTFCHSPARLHESYGSGPTFCHSPARLHESYGSGPTFCHSPARLHESYGSGPTFCHSPARLHESYGSGATFCHSPARLHESYGSGATFCHSPARLHESYGSGLTFCHSPARFHESYGSGATFCHSPARFHESYGSGLTFCHSPARLHESYGSTSRKPWSPPKGLVYLMILKPCSRWPFRQPMVASSEEGERFLETRAGPEVFTLDSIVATARYTRPWVTLVMGWLDDDRNQGRILPKLATVAWSELRKSHALFNHPSVARQSDCLGIILKRLATHAFRPVPAQDLVLLSNGKRGSGPNSGQKDTTWTKIFVGGLDFKTTDKELKAHFEQFGEIEEAAVILDRTTGKSKGYGFYSFGKKKLYYCQMITLAMNEGLAPHITMSDDEPEIAKCPADVLRFPGSRERRKSIIPLEIATVD
ncbi:unnamed protein product [Cyprideis torosa]|uniref:Uncharacterized protein n=1 Tax=Cyprideis torosa TaxID=163714 RepID=A0A7R8ZLT2_9CRUS|nr:unnamed protein product [Cyprideis torosa]CAG0892560.1 unnamed protein product [Cyprideis torosa]